MDVYEEVREFYRSYRGEKRVIGRSVAGRSIYAMRVGNGAETGIAQYAIHAREWVTAYLALEHVRRGVPRGAVWIIPLANPDGALLAKEGLGSVIDARRRDFLIRVNGGEDFSLWKGNVAAVDLNVNFDAAWGTGKENVQTLAPANYIGTAPMSEPESRALAAFTVKVMPQFTVSYHTKGEEIYWRFRQPVFRAARDKRLARVLSRATGYPLADAKGSAGGYKDWCIQKLGISAFTVEAGRADIPHPLTLSALPDLVSKNLDAIAALADAI